jgi:O-antigen/teichoic acid export membrane protein
MGHAKTIARNSLWSLTDSLLGMASSLGCSVAVARVMGPEKLGYYSYLTFLASMAGWIAAFGIPSAIRRYAAEAYGRGDFITAKLIIRATFRIQLALAVVTVAAGLAVVWLFVPLEHRSYAVITVVGILPLLLYTIPTAAISATEDLAPNVKASIVSTFVTAGVTAAALVFDWGLPGLASAMLAARTTDLVLREIAYRRIYAQYPDPPRRERLPPELRRKIARFCWQATMITALELLVWERSEVFFLERFSTIVQVAFYSLSFNLSQHLLLLPRVASTAAAATFSVQQGRDPRQTTGLAVGTMRVLAMICIPAAFGLGALAEPLLRTLYGAKFLPAIPAFAILAILTLGKALQMPARQLLTAADKQTLIVKWGLVLAVINLAIDFALIPRYGALGAAIAKGTIQVIGAVSIWSIVVAAFQARLPLGRLGRTTVAALAMYLAVRALSAAVPPVVAVALGPPLGIAIVMVLFRLLRCLEPGDRATLLAIQRRLPSALRRGYGALIDLMFPAAANPATAPIGKM